jgi:hypothetical protein
MKEIRLTFHPDGSVEIDGSVFDGCDDIINALKKGLRIENAPSEHKGGRGSAVYQHQRNKYKT